MCLSKPALIGGAGFGNFVGSESLYPRLDWTKRAADAWSDSLEVAICRCDQPRCVARRFAAEEARAACEFKKVRAIRWHETTRTVIEIYHGRRGADDPVICDAVRMLSDHNLPAPELDNVRVRPLSPGVAGRCLRRTRRIEISNSGPAYQMALAGDVRLLASYLAHEYHHQLYGNDEAPAYTEQIRVLRELNGSPAVIAAVQRTMAEVLSEGY